MARVRSNHSIFRVEDPPQDPEAWMSGLVSRINALPEMGLSPTPACGWIEPSRRVGYFGVGCASWSANMLRAVEAELQRAEDEHGISFQSTNVSKRSDPREQFPIGVLAAVELGRDVHWWNDGPSDNLSQWIDANVGSDGPQCG